MQTQNEFVEKTLNEKEDERRSQLEHIITKASAFGVALGILLVWGIWLAAPAYKQFIWYGVVMAPLPLLYFLRPIFRKREKFWTTLFLYTMILVVFLIPLLSPEALIAMAIGHILFFLLYGVVLGSRKILGIGTVSVIAIAIDILVGARVVELWFIPLPEPTRTVVIAMLTVFVMSCVLIIIYLFLGEQERIYRQMLLARIESENARAVAEEAARAKTAFLASMSHELRTPLNAIINFTQLIATGTAGPVTEDQASMLNTALGSSKHLLQLINDVLDMSKIQAGKLTLYIEDNVNLCDEIKTVIEMAEPLLQRQNAALEKPLQFIQDIDKDLPVITCDRRRVRQIILNLLSNAIKFTEKGSVTLSVKNKEKEIIFVVLDTGPGIPPEMQKRIFEPFTQTADGVKSEQGTGLGLPISRSLAQAQGGNLWLESHIGEGSTFFFTLPIRSPTTLQ